MAWLLAATGKGPEITGPALLQSAATPHRGDLRHGLTFMDTLEAWLTPATAP